MLRRDFITLKKISEEISIALEFIADTPIEVFLSNEMIKHATGMTAINIGELVKNLSEDLRVEYSHIPWKQIAGFRDIAAHKYGTLDMNYVYDTVTNDYPVLKAQIEEILKDA